MKIKRQQVKAIVKSLVSTASGSQIVEFAVSLPLLMVLAVGIFDFGNAYNLKQKVTHASREAARIGSSQSTLDLNPGTTPASIQAIALAVSKDLQDANLSDCGLGGTLPVAAGGAPGWKWSFTTSCGAAGNLVLTIDRGKVITTAMFANLTPIKVIGTSATLLYPYKWEFNRVIGLLVPGATYPGTSQIAVTTYMANQN